MEQLMIRPTIQTSAACPSAPETRIICRVCQKQFSQYTCPRCNTRYCSLQCYKNHSLRCTESFMHENVTQELKQIQPNDETKQKMLDILKRFHSEEEEEEEEEEEQDVMDSSNDEDGTLLRVETIEKVLSGKQVRLEDLSPEEMRMFQKAITTGELSKMIKPWTPWWTTLSAKTISLSQDGAQLVRPVQDDQETSIRSLDDDSEVELSDVPPGPNDPLTPLSKLVRGNPSPLVAVHLVDVMYCYCFTLRLYNGDWLPDALGAATLALSVSNVLGEAAQPETVRDALIGCLERTCSPTYLHMGGPRFGLALIDDTTSLLSLGRNALICGLCDLKRLIQFGERELKSEKSESRKNGKGWSRRLQKAERKVYFFMCWVHEQPAEAWSSLAAIVTAEKAYFAAIEESKGKSMKPNVKDSCAGKVLIEEVQ